MPRPWTPLLGSASDQFEGRRLYLVSAGLGAAASFAFAAWAHGFAAAMVLRFLGGIAFAGVHMPGLKLLVDRVAPGRQARAAALYTSCYAVGSAASLLIAGVVDAVFGWRATFIAGGIGQLLAIGALALLPAAPARPALAAAARLLEFRPVLRNRAVMAYVAGFAGNTWEVFAVRVWFVAYLAWALSLPGNGLRLPPLGVVAGLASLAGLPVSIAVAELAMRHGRQRTIIAACIFSVVVCLALAATAGGPSGIVMALLILVQIHQLCRCRGARRRGRVGGRSGPARSGARHLRARRLWHRFSRPGGRRLGARLVRRGRERCRLARGVCHDRIGLGRCRLRRAAGAGAGLEPVPALSPEAGRGRKPPVLCLSGAAY